MPVVTSQHGAEAEPSHPGAVRASRLQVIAGFAVIYLVWGSTYLAIAYAVRSLPPVLTTAARFAVAGAVLCAWAWWRGAPRPVWVEWRAATIAGAVLVVGGTATVCWAEQWVPSGLTSLLVATVPLWFVLLEWMAPGGQRPHGLVAAGVALGLIGLGVLTNPFNGPASGAHVFAPAAVLMLAAILWAVGSLYSRRAPLPASGTMGTGMQMMIGGLLCFPVGLALGENPRIDVTRVPAAAWIAVAYLTVVGSLTAFTTYLWLLRVSTPSRVATHAYVNPVVAVALGWAVAGEPLTARILVAAGLIIGAVVLITSGQHRVTIADAMHPTLPTEPA
jgi:drug/metabolite transporter (DMT)-like permease